MRILEELGLIKSKQVGNQRYKLVLLVDPLHAVAELREKEYVPEPWWEAYLLRLMGTKEADANRGQEKVCGDVVRVAGLKPFSGFSVAWVSMGLLGTPTFSPRH